MRNFRNCNKYVSKNLINILKTQGQRNTETETKREGKGLKKTIKIQCFA